MDLGIRGRRAIVCGSSRGLGRGCAEALAAAGVEVIVNGRDGRTADATAHAISQTYGVRAVAIAADVATTEGRATLLAACPDPDILVTNSAGPPLGDFRSWDRETWLEVVERMMLAPILLMREVVDAMAARRFGRIVNITSNAVRKPALDRGMTNATKSGLTGFSTGLARQLARHNVTVNNLLPGLCATDRGREAIAERAALSGVSLEKFEAQMLTGIPAGTLGDPRDFGDICAFLCSAQAGYLTRQNILFDGGWFEGWS